MELQPGGAAGHRQLLSEDLVDEAYDAIFTFRLPDQVITDWNRGAEELYGYSRAEAVGRQAQELLHSGFERSREQVIEAVTRDGRWSGTIVQTGRDGKQVLVDARWVFKPDLRGTATGAVLEINRDVTPRELAAERFRLVVESLHDYAIFMLDARGRIASWNAGAASLTGWSRAEVTGRALPLLATGEGDHDKLSRDLLDRAERIGSAAEEGWLARRDGTAFWGRTRVAVLRGPANLVFGFAVVVHDQTEQRDLEMARANFVSFAAHEMRSPVTLLHGYLSMLDSGDITLEQFARAMPTILARTDELQLLIEQMIESSRLEDGGLELKLERIDLRPIVEEIVNVSRRLAGDQRHIELDIPRSDVLVVADPLRVRSIVRNLLDNAIKYSPGGGAIHCRVTTDRDRAEVSVSDHGIGIRKQDLPIVFSRYGRINAEQTRGIAGAGLGLYMSRELARLQHGEVTVLSTPGEGSTFTLVLPLAGHHAAPEPTF